jgi:hypothetical protein
MSRALAGSGGAGSVRTPIRSVPPSSGRMSSAKDRPVAAASAPSAPSSVGGVNSPASTPPSCTARAYNRLICFQLPPS